MQEKEEIARVICGAYLFGSTVANYDCLTQREKDRWLDAVNALENYLTANQIGE